MNREQLLSENEKRKIQPDYDPIKGIGCYGERRKVVLSDIGTFYLPTSMIKVKWVSRIIVLGSIKKYCEKYHLEQYYEGVCREWIIERCKHDCEYWLATFAKIKIKNKTKDGTLIPSKTQRTVLYAILDDWYAKNPVRFIVVKCRQAFITTIITGFNTWVQLNIFENWNSLICGDVENQATNVRGMQDKMVTGIPAIFTASKTTYEIAPFEGSSKTRIIKQRKCRISTGSMQKPENVRSADNMSCHLTEVGLWKTTLGKTPEDLIQAIRGGMDDVAYTVFGMESSPKGVGNYFYEQWVAAKKGKSDLKPIFLPWFWVDRYSKPIKNYDVFFDTWLNHEKKEYIDYLWSLGCTLESINWYFDKLLTMEHWRVQSEFPSDDVEAFQTTGRRVFPPNHVQKRRDECIDPIECCDIEADDPKSLKNVRFGNLSDNLKIWSKPDNSIRVNYRYVVTVDIGKGKSKDADFSDILVLDRYERMYGGCDEVAAEWHGKIDIDLLAWKAAQLAQVYGNALLVIEKNTIDTITEFADVLLSEVAKVYDNMYATVKIDKVKGTKRTTFGFHTNSSTKPVVVSALQAALRDDTYRERNKEACNELDTYELKEDGTFGSADKCHDDMVMTRAIGLHISSKMPIPEEVKNNEVKLKKVLGMTSM
ncbi:MAG: hypothetical protein ACMV0Y_06060 [Paludibacter sp.]